MPIILCEKIAKKFIHSKYFCAIKIQNLRYEMKKFAKCRFQKYRVKFEMVINEKVKIE